MTINIQKYFSFLPFHILPSIVSIWSAFSLDLMQLIMTNLGNHFDCCQIQVGAETLLHISMVYFCGFMKIF